MIRLLPLSFLLPLALPAVAQRPDTIRPRPVAIGPDSLRGIIRDEVIVTYTPLPPLLPLQEQFRQVAGVQATPYSGAPGTGEVVRIRGAASINNHVQPLYVVDGVPMFQYRFPTSSPYDIGLFDPEGGSNPLLSIPTGDVEQVQVLKGAYATGQYGSLGQNGVILITTKRGKANQPLRVRYTGYGGVQQARRRYDLLGAQELSEVVNEANRNDGYNPQYSPDQIAAFGRGTDWQDELLRTAAVQEHHLSTDGGTKFGTRYYLGADYLRQTGIVLNSSLQRYALRLNLDQQIGRRVQLGGGLSYGETQERRLALTGLKGVALPEALLYLPMVPVYAPNGDYATTDDGYLNPVQLAQQNYGTPRNRRLLAHGQVQVELLTGLKLDLRASLERDKLQASDYESPGSRIATRLPGLEIQVRHATYQQRLLNPVLRFERTFGEKHSVQASVESLLWQRDESEDFTNSNRSDQPPFAVLAQRRYANERSQRYRIVTARMGYTYAGRYAVAASLQHSTNWHMLGFQTSQALPAAQITWHAGEETWLKDRGIISQLDTWVGWGTTSSQGSLGFTSMDSNGFSYYLVSLNELTTQRDAGLDVGLWHNRLRFSTALYRRETEIQVGLFSNPGQPTVLNRGLEITLATTWQAGKFSGTSSLATAFNHNRYEQPVSTGLQAYWSGDYFILQPGQPVSSFYGTRYLGPDAKGDPQFASGPNGYGPKGEPIGSGLPRQLLSLGQTAHYGRLSLQLQLDGMFGYQVADTNLRLLDLPTGYFNSTTRVRDRWTPANPNTQVPRAGGRLDLFEGLSSYTLQSGNHVRLSALTLAAEVWKRDSRNVSLFLSGNNLLVISKYRGFDPNVSGGEANPKQAGLDRGYYPTARTVAVGVRATL